MCHFFLHTVISNDTIQIDQPPSLEPEPWLLSRFLVIYLFLLLSNVKVVHNNFFVERDDGSSVVV